MLARERALEQRIGGRAIVTSRTVPIIDRVTDAFFALDTDFRFTYLNERAETLLKRSREDLIGRVMWDEFPQTVETQFPDGFHRAMDEQVPVSFEIYHARLETWFEARAYPSETGLSVYMRDVTERKQQETTIAQHAAVIEAINDGVVTLDRNREIVSVNGAMERLFGRDREALVGEHVEVVPELAGITDEDAVEMGRAIADVDVGNAEKRQLEATITDADGVDRMVEIRFVPIEDDAATIAGVLRDITDQHEYERVAASLHEITRWLLESDDPEEICAIAVHSGSDLLDLPISGIWLLEDEHGYLEPVAGTAGAYEEFGGLPRFNPGEGLVWNVFEGGEVERFDDLESNEETYNPETPLRSEIIAPIGTHGVLMTGSLEPDRFDETDVELLSTLAENIRAALDRADRERILRERTEALERQTERLEGVANVLSNDLKQQLETVAERLEDDDADADELGWEFPLAEDSVETTLDRAERLVDDVREFARNASAVGTRSRVRLDRAVEAAARTSRLDETNVTVERRATVRADADRLVNLLETAFDDAAARDGVSPGDPGDETADVTVRVGLLGFDDPGRSRGFYLLDDADASPETARDRLLASPDGTGSGAGAADGNSDTGTGAIDGLGLALVRAIAEAHGWELTVETVEGDGTREGVVLDHDPDSDHDSDEPANGTRIEIRDVTTLELEGNDRHNGDEDGKRHQDGLPRPGAGPGGP
ncbi:histidine kinase [Halobiforma lacisalsi AJ5]|uniref:histidine kinase n=1 Tax=Natronobacterium lacisalsi AJ5 TaxID=358396 RepID=M0LGT3_NATLA|nr:PAS domain-containing protein [Halobiforma lacisalsi]APW99083.1 histidine kinase [Halobiforma lacisalsi AJ5]EMA31200.1 PAS sensor protein [Halobiforma lacisalsi AJ5]